MSKIISTNLDFLRHIFGYPLNNDTDISAESTVKSTVESKYRIRPCSYEKNKYYVEEKIFGDSWFSCTNYKSSWNSKLFTKGEAYEKVRQLKIQDAKNKARQDEVDEWLRTVEIEYY